MTSIPRIVIIGAGPAGLGAAWRLNELGHDNWMLLEASETFGGLAGSVTDEHGFTWDVGGHVLFSHYEYFDKLLDHLLGDQWVHHQRESWIWMRNRFIPYPMQKNLWRLPAEELHRCLEGLEEIQRQPSHPIPADFRQWIIRTFGQALADTFMLPYNFKVWAYDPARLDVGWMGERVATIDLQRLRENTAAKRDDISWGPNAKFRFPLHGGTGAIWRSLASKLPREKLNTRCVVTGIDSQRRIVHTRDGKTFEYDHLLSTMPLDMLLTSLTDQPGLMSLASKFVHSSSHIVGIGIDAPAAEKLRTKCWMYFPEPTVPFYRVTVFSNYSPHNVARPGEQASLMCEVSESPEKPVDPARVVDDVQRGLLETGLIEKDAPIISRWHRRIEHGYPTPFLGRDQLLGQIDPVLIQNNLWSRGRFGAWKYEVSNQDHSLMQGVEVIDRILLGIPEQTYSQPDLVNAGQKVRDKRV